MKILTRFLFSYDITQMHKFKSRSTKNVIGLKLSGRLTREEYREIVPILEDKIAKFGKIRLLLELDHWEGWGPYAALNDIVFVFKNSLKIERVAFVVKSKDDRQAVLIDQPFSPWFRDNTRYFSIKEKEAAWRWVGEGIQGFDLPKYEEEAYEDTSERPQAYGPKMEVLILGGGIAGLMLAMLLQIRGFSPKIVETEEFSPTNARMLTLWPSATGILKSLGIYKKVKRQATQLHSFSVFNEKGQPLKIFDNTGLEKHFGNTYMVPHEHMINLLSDAIDPDSFRYETSATKIEELSDAVKVTFSDSSEHTFDCVICADGLHSKLRNTLFQSHTTAYTGWSSWSFVISPDLPLPTDTFAYLANDKYIQFIACEGKLHVFIAAKIKDIVPQNFDYLKFFKENFANFPPFALNIINNLQQSDKVIYQPYVHLEQNKRIKPRIALLGQAAFVYPLTTFFGDTSTIESAYILADELSRSDSKTIKSALERYEKRCISRFLNNQCTPPDILNPHTTTELFENFWKQYLQIPF